jgi:phage portal protein BeeE
MLPLQMLMSGCRTTAARSRRRHPLYDILHDKPNVWQDSFQWRRQKMYHLIDSRERRTNRIVPGARGFVDQLQPVIPRSAPTAAGERPIWCTTSAIRRRIRNDVHAG